MSVNNRSSGGNSEYPLVTLIEVPENSEFSMELMVSIADLLDIDTRELPPIKDSIDPDILNNLYKESGPPFDGQISFNYAGKTIIIFGATRNGPGDADQPRYVFVAIKDRT